MKGIATVFRADGAVAQLELEAPLSLEQLQKLVGGYFQQVPHWHSYLHQRCIAFCNEDGRSLDLPINHRATKEWMRVAPEFESNLLFGLVVVITGDEILRAMRDE